MTARASAANPCKIFYRPRNPKPFRIMRIESRRRIHTLALAVLSLYLPLFAHGQETAGGFTNAPAADLPRRSQTASEMVVLPPSVPDPLEPLNRVMWGFNKALMT